MPSIHKTARVQPGASGKVGAFSLIEVVVAVGIFAIGIVAVIGLLSPTIKSVTNVTDSTTANRLADNIQLELQRIGFTNLTVPLGGSGNATMPVALPLTLVANRDGSRVAQSTGSGETADNPVTGSPPGIANQDRYYKVTVQAFPSGNTLAYTSGSGFLALSVQIAWPFQVPTNASGGFTTVPTSQQSTMLLNMALNP